jgi:hypothetical protein
LSFTSPRPFSCPPFLDYNKYKKLKPSASHVCIWVSPCAFMVYDIPFQILIDKTKTRWSVIFVFDTYSGPKTQQNVQTAVGTIDLFYVSLTL